MLLFSDYCLSCLETTTARQEKKVWILNGMKNSTAARLPPSTVRQFLQRQGWMLVSVLNCREKAQLRYMQHYPWGPWPAHWCDSHCKGDHSSSTGEGYIQLAAPSPRALMGVERASIYGSSPLLPCTNRHCLDVAQPFPNCLFCCNLSWPLCYA